MVTVIVNSGVIDLVSGDKVIASFELEMMEQTALLKLIKLNIELQALVQLLKEKSSIILEDVADSTNQDIQHVDWIDQRGVQHKLN
ncbi:MAG: hypothetical protein IAA89_00800 [Firmicutes bacterium]|uniref:Uncharacterized protein n=1 Tax=Candidatus Gallilactobacillus intestinavium TaxID=2840838 RepID=A0A9D9E8M1_9LACO|nr:hypothetical protein [Candidatus Gallilactobacillus intestinavium]